MCGDRDATRLYRRQRLLCILPPLRARWLQMGQSWLLQVRAMHRQLLMRYLWLLLRHHLLASQSLHLRTGHCNCRSPIHQVRPLPSHRSLTQPHVAVRRGGSGIAGAIRCLVQWRLLASAATGLRSNW